MKYEISSSALSDIKADVTIVLVVEKNLKHTWIKDKKILENIGFKGESEEATLVPNSSIVYVGCNNLNHDEIRIAAAKAYTHLKNTKYKSVKVGSYLNKNGAENIKAFVEGFELGSYAYDRYKSKKVKTSLTHLIISTEDINKKSISSQKAKKALERGLIFAQATNYVKDIVNTPPQDFTPLEMAKEAKKLGKLKDVTCEVYDEKFLQKEKMGSFLAVNRSSVHPPRLIHLIYKPKNPQKRVIFVGKGLTYDSGGLSLKPSTSMVTMKSDKSGASAVLGIIKGAQELKLPFEIHGIIGATENMIGGDSFKPDDVLTSRSGTTIEVRNTDAEGRLVLCDCLDYAQDFKPDLLVDMATLTGACVVGLGEFTTAIIGNNEKLQNELYTSSKNSGELTTPLHANRYLKKTLKSSIADICNVSSTRYGGSITAGLFLERFIKDEYKDKWLHLDIAGPAYVESEWGYNQVGASGAGVRLNLQWLLELAKEA